MATRFEHAIALALHTHRDKLPPARDQPPNLNMWDYERMAFAIAEDLARQFDWGPKSRKEDIGISQSWSPLQNKDASGSGT